MPSLNNGLPLDQEFLESALIRWALSKQYVDHMPMQDFMLEAALGRFLGVDVPMIIEELFRFRPDLKSPQGDYETTVKP